MPGMSRRKVLGTSLGVAAGGVLARPYVARAAAKTAEVWWTQGFIPEEDESFRKMVADYERASGNTIDYSILPFVALEQKMVSALQTNNTPDVISFDGIETTLVLNAWNDKLVDVSDIVATQEKKFSSTALLSTKLYNKVNKGRAFYAVPYKSASAPFHVWSDLVEKAGYKMADIPNTWDARWDWFKPMQAKLRGKGMRQIYPLGLQMTTNGPSDGNAVFTAFLIANGGKDIITPDGKEHTDDPQVREAVIKTITYFTNAYKQGYVPPGAISWSDSDDNNAFHSKLILMDFDGTISTELAMFHRPKDLANCATLGLPLGNDGKPLPAAVGVVSAMLPKTGKNPEVAKEFMRYVIEPKVNNEYLKAGLGRFVPVFPELAHTDPFWLHNSNPELAPHLTPYVTETLLGPTIPADYIAYNPAYGEVEAQQVWGESYAQVYKDGKTPEQAADWAFAQIKASFAKYPIAAAA
jgi:multiple sugar transport system substrate-binding protein